jgi:hypothetical protein
MTGINMKLVVVAIVTYFVYVISFVCPLNESAGVFDLRESSPLSYHTCMVSNRHLKPLYQEVVYPRYLTYVQPTVVSLDHTFSITSKFVATKQFISDLDKDSKISNFVESCVQQVEKKLAHLNHYLSTEIYPTLEMKWSIFVLNVKYWLQLTSIRIESWWKVVKAQVAQVWVVFDPYWKHLMANETIGRICAFFAEIKEKLLVHTNHIKMEGKRNFIKKEFKNLIKFNEFGSERISGERFRGAVNEKRLRITELVRDLLGMTGVKDIDSSDEYDYDDEPLTILITSTITVSATATDDVSVTAPADPRVVKLDEELSYWDFKVNKTLLLAANNLESEMEPLVELIIESTKGNISELFQTLQKDNYHNYQTLNNKIVLINKDFETIRLNNKTDLETVTREEFRDLISAARQLPEIVSEQVQEILIEKHEIIVGRYFKVIQDTIDILETFADTTIQEFSKKLATVLEEMGLEDDELSWSAWKRFHKVKEQIFEFRDFIFDTAHEYKKNNANNKELGVLGLSEWNIYLKNVETHINFLIRDNHDYLDLVRAKGNVAFQLREGLVRDILASPVTAEESEKKAEPIESSKENDISEEPIEKDSEDEVLKELEAEDEIKNSEEKDEVEEVEEEESEEPEEVEEEESEEPEEVEEEESEEPEELEELEEGPEELEEPEAILEGESETEEISEEGESETEEISEEGESETEEISEEGESETEEISEEEDGESSR